MTIAVVWSAQVVLVSTSAPVALIVFLSGLAMTCGLLLPLRARYCILFISGQGQIRLSAYSNAAPKIGTSEQGAAMDLFEVADSTLVCAFLILLRLNDHSGRKQVVLIFPDSTSTDTFRRLSVVCRWLSSSNSDRIKNNLQKIGQMTELRTFQSVNTLSVTRVTDQQGNQY